MSFARVCWSVGFVALSIGGGEVLAQEQPKPAETLGVWPDLAPGEDSRDVGEPLPFRESEKPQVTRLVDIRRPTLDVFPASEPNGTAVVVLPGGGFGKVVPDKEGSELAPFLNRLGISVFVLKYRTNENRESGEPSWKRPAQDTQRALRLIRRQASRWQLDPSRVGLLALSAGGQVGAIVHTADQPFYESVDEIDAESIHPDFSMLIYPWKILDSSGKQLLSEINVTESASPAFLVHTHDDASSAVGTALLYIELKNAGVPSELHVYQNGGHGYGLREQKGSVISTWVDRATDWLMIRGLGKPR
ncbi:alpha/beta hydrolase [Rhodopirellula halodulae]|uniref:alpha/beta hydrolase n=1 Tax=Rhodopirellula halodulae TaxID=2894198 RepID=UPI001E2F6F83|nr:alpha/beta hydrolase [Rhodopirellula sp. JC737]MCC9657638.1 alpha/beta hydrolase [Rhodopirellula sp. JC737]